MKKLLIFLILALPVFSFAQGYTATPLFVNAVSTTDTSFVIRVSHNYTWNILVKWTANNATTATVKIQTSIDGTTYTDYANMSSVTLTGTTGWVTFEDEYLSANYIRVYYTHEAGKMSTISGWYNFKSR